MTLERRTPLSRTTPLSPGSPLRRTAGLARGGRLPFRSERRQREHREQRKPLTDALAIAYPFCQVPRCRRASADAHELVTRARGGSTTDLANILCVCRWHHDLITQHPHWAEAHGLMLPSWAGDYEREIATRLRRANGWHSYPCDCRSPFRMVD